MVKILATGKSGFSKNLATTCESVPQEYLRIRDRSESPYGFYFRAVFVNESSASQRRSQTIVEAPLGKRAERQVRNEIIKYHQNPSFNLGFIRLGA
jgi:hypothetical protein